MPKAPRRPCRMTGCPNLAEHGEQYCAEHRRDSERFYNRYLRPTPKGAYGRAWTEIRSRYYRAHPLCEDCLKAGALKTAEEVHHIVPLADGGTHAEGNLVSLCRSCHLKRHGQMGTRRARGAEE